MSMFSALKVFSDRKTYVLLVSKEGEFYAHIPKTEFDFLHCVRVAAIKFLMRTTVEDYWVIINDHYEGMLCVVNVEIIFPLYGAALDMAAEAIQLQSIMEFFPKYYLTEEMMYATIPTIPISLN